MTIGIAKSASDIHRAALGGVYIPYPFAGDVRQRVPLTQLLKRYSYWVHRCITINSQVAASVPYKLYSTSRRARGVDLGRSVCRPASNKVKAYILGKTALKPSTTIAKAARYIDDLTEVPQHPVLDLLDKPNAWSSGYEQREANYADQHWAGRSFTHYTGDELWRIMPHTCEVIPDVENFVRGFKIGIDTPNPKMLTTEEVLWVRLYDPGDPWGGLGPLEAWLRTVDAGEHIQQFWTWIFERGGTPDYIHKSDVLPDKKQRDAFMSQWQRFFGKMAAKLRNIAFIGGKGAELVRLGQTNKELEFTQSAREVRDQIANAFGVPQSMVTQDIGARANAREADEQYVKYTIWPYVCRYESAINEQLIHRHFGEELLLIHENPVPEDQALRIEMRKALLETGSTVDEVRIQDDQEPLGTEEANEPLVATGLSTLDAVVNPPEPMGVPGLPGDDAGQQPMERARVAFEIAKAGLPYHSASGQLAALDYNPDEIVRILGPAPIELPAPAPVLRLRRHVEPVSLSRIWHDLYSGSLNGWDRCSKAKPRAQQGLEVPPGLGVEIRAILSEQFDKIADEMLKGQTSALEAMADPAWVQRLTDALKADLELSIVQGGARGVSRLAGKGIDFDVRNPKVQEFIDQYVIRLATEINGTTQVLLSGLVGKELAQGASVDKIAEAIRALDADVSPYRATMIARTESTRAFMAGQQESWRQSGVVMAKQWLLAPDACEFCAAVAKEFTAKSIPVDQPFYQQGVILQGSQGGSMNLDYSNVDGPPLHPHCRCDLIPVLST